MKNTIKKYHEMKLELEELVAKEKMLRDKLRLEQGPIAKYLLEEELEDISRTCIEKTYTHKMLEVEIKRKRLNKQP